METVAAAFPINMGGRDEMDNDDCLTGAVPPAPMAAETPEGFVDAGSRFSDIDVRFPSPLPSPSRSLDCEGGGAPAFGLALPAPPAALLANCSARLFFLSMDIG